MIFHIIIRKRKWMTRFIHLFCLCPLSLTIKLNFGISRVAYWSFTPKLEDLEGTYYAFSNLISVLAGSQLLLRLNQQKLSTEYQIWRMKLKGTRISCWPTDQKRDIISSSQNSLPLICKGFSPPKIWSVYAITDHSHRRKQKHHQSAPVRSVVVKTLHLKSHVRLSTGWKVTRF